MAKEGMTFSAHYCGSAVCAPSRCSLMTGLHSGHAYIRSNSPGYPNGQTPLPEETETVAKLARRAGYTTAIIGKWGLGGVLKDEVIQLLIVVIRIFKDLIISLGIWISEKRTIIIQIIYGVIVNG